MYKNIKIILFINIYNIDIKTTTKQTILMCTYEEEKNTYVQNEKNQSLPYLATCKKMVCQSLSLSLQEFNECKRCSLALTKYTYIYTLL